MSRALRTLGRRLREANGSMWPLALAMALGLVVATGVLVRVGSATVLRGDAQTAADAAALALAETDGDEAEARRIAAQNGAELVSSGVQGVAGAGGFLTYVARVQTNTGILGREGIHGQARSAATRAAPRGAVGANAETGTPSRGLIQGTGGPCPISRTDWTRFAADTPADPGAADVSRIRAFLSQRGFTVGPTLPLQLGCTPANGQASLAAVAAQLGRLGFQIQYTDGFPAPTLVANAGPGDGFTPAGSLSGEGRARLVPVIADDVAQGGPQ